MILDYHKPYNNRDPDSLYKWNKNEDGTFESCNINHLIDLKYFIIQSLGILYSSHSLSQIWKIFNFSVIRLLLSLYIFQSCHI